MVHPRQPVAVFHSRMATRLVLQGAVPQAELPVAGGIAVPVGERLDPALEPRALQDVGGERGGRHGCGGSTAFARSESGEVVSASQAKRLQANWSAWPEGTACMPSHPPSPAAGPENGPDRAVTPASTMSTHTPAPSATAASEGYAPRQDPPAPNGSRAWSPLAVKISKLPDGPVNALCGATAGVASGIVTCPLDVIKTRLQAQGSFRPRTYTGPTRAVYKGLTGTAQVIWTQDGVRGLYRGLGPMLLGYIPTWAVYMSTYESTRDYLSTKMAAPTENKWLARTLASVAAGGCSTLVTNPIWVVKTRLMAQVSARAAEESRPPWHYKNTFDAFHKMYTKEGIGSFYSGLAPALLGLTHVAIQFPLYEFLKMKFTGLEMGKADATSEDVHWPGIMAATFISKIVATSATYPHEVLRTRLQTQQRELPTNSHDHVSFRGGRHGIGHQTRPPGTSSSDGMVNMPRYRGVVKTFTVILREEGWRAFYNGMGTNMVRAVPAAITTMMTFESLKLVHQRLKNEGKRMKDQDS
ncbi:mitochondrial carrier [Dothidotthia symphoricarpi CBS 119687]|uniref:Mitochondrial carrier n=1 Tax=Dothidotthia symphoricarpi CBS 119687 TaxID=1392245 RepID=A0A6A6A648_9PLEO|nr:mitochondrial carrier [Dothidotthia symphoricarpi CBS 119687]KAF2127359.1 mitochondrial carrier [Dothidotthia symphoricarpi CBS 119687]